MKAVLKKKVKYGGVFYNAGVAFSINPEDRNNLEKIGATIIEEEINVEANADNVNLESDAEKKTGKKKG